MNRSPKFNRFIAIIWMLVGLGGVLLPLLTRSYTVPNILLMLISVAVICLNWVRFDRNR
ncbi:MAG: hypothetical protein IJQ02_07105 [Oscillospiraceae bacterium]|nr:hypothetical protein [Oscillospiraceae bacterium]